MPQLAGAAAAWAVTAWTSAVTVVNTAMVAAAGAALPGLSFGAQLAVANFATKAVVFGGLAAASAALMRPNIPSSGTSLDFKPDPKAPVRGAMGYTALGGNKVFQATWGYKKVAMSLGVALSLGPIDQVPRFEADGATVSFSGPQNEATGFYAADMWQRTTLGLPGDAALLPPTGLKYGNPGLTGWGTQHAAPHVSFSFWTMVLAKNPEDRDVFTNGVPDPRWIGRWMKLWDPRKDSTYPGGSGPQRRDDWRTWEWSESPYVHALAWMRGHYKLNLDGTIDRSKRIAGIGAPDAAIDIPALVEGMNVAQANNWTISGEWSTSDGKFQTLLAMLQAGGGEPISRGAQISVMVNAPRVATYTYTRDDLIGQAEIRPLTPRRERKNTIVPRYKSEANGWQYVPAGEVTSSVYRNEDRGEPRSLEIEYTHVRSAKQAGQLAAYDLANLREGLTATLPSKVHLMHVHPGDCITVDVPELALAGQKFVVRRATVNHKAASVTLELLSESDGKHAWALGQAAQPAPSPSLSAVDPKYVPPPAPEDWTAVPKPPSEGGVSQPIVIIELPIETTDIVAVIIKHGPSAAGPWTDGYEGSPRSDGRYEVAGLTPGESYCVSLQYVAKNGAKSDPDIKCGIVAGDLIAGDTTHLKGEPVQDILNLLTNTADLTAANAAAVADMGDRVDGVIAEAEDILAGAEGAAALAVLKAGEAGDAAEASNTAAGIATTKADEAGASATAANAEKLAAEAARDTADQKAQASVLAAAQAEAFAGDAGDWAAASEGAAVQAAARAGEGLTYRNQAVDARDGAVAANISAGASAQAAHRAVIKMLPSRPSEGSDFTSNLGGTPEGAPDLTAGTVVSVAGEGNVREIAGTSVNIQTKGALAVGDGRTFRITARMRVTVDGANNTQLVHFRILDAAYGSIVPTSSLSVPQAMADGWLTRSYELTSEQIKASWPTAAYIRGALRTNRAGATTAYSGATTQVAELRLEDVTESASAASSAATAITQTALASNAASEAAINANIAASVGGGGVLKDPTFNNWPAADPRPVGVAAPVGNLALSRQTVNVIYGDKALRMNDTGGGNAYFALAATAHAPASDSLYWVVEYVVDVNSGDLRRFGVQFRANRSTGYYGATVDLAANHPTTVVGATYRGSQLFQVTPTGSPAGPTTTCQSWFYTNLSSFSGGAYSAKNLTLQKLQFRPATPEEIAAGTVLPAVEGQLAIVAAAAADATDRLGSARFSVTGGAGGDPFDISLKAGPAGSDASLTATKVRLRNIVNGQAIDALVIENGKAKFTGDVAIVGGTLNINNRFLVGADGAMTVRSSTGSSRMEITNNAIKIYNNGVKRVQIGDLTA